MIGEDNQEARNNHSAVHVCVASFYIDFLRCCFNTYNDREIVGIYVQCM